jgi:hypothetical protein
MPVENMTISLTDPFTVVAYWAGWGKGVGKTWVHWNSSVKYLGKRGFKVDARDHVKGAKFPLKTILDTDAAAKELHGLYFWGHGFWPYPSDGLVSDSGDKLLLYADTGLNYHMGLGLVFACDSNSGRWALVSDNAIWHGYTGTLNPVLPPGQKFHVDNWFKAGQQATH